MPVPPPERIGMSVFLNAPAMASTVVFNPGGLVHWRFQEKEKTKVFMWKGSAPWAFSRPF
jgi:hypothetical protein